MTGNVQCGDGELWAVFSSESDEREARERERKGVMQERVPPEVVYEKWERFRSSRKERSAGASGELVGE